MLHKLVLLSLAAFSIARPDGAPICEVDKFDASNHGGATSDLKYDIAVTPEGNKATIAINDQFIGLLLYVSDASGKHVGTLQSSTGDFKIVKDCGGQTTITHSSSASKSGKFEWTGTETGPLTVNAIVMKDEQLWNIFKVPLQIGQSPSTAPPQNSPANTYPTKKNTYHSKHSSSGRHSSSGKHSSDSGEIPDPSSPSEYGEIPDPSLTSDYGEIPDPSLPTEIPDPSLPTEIPDPSLPTEIPDPLLPSDPGLQVEPGKIDVQVPSNSTNCGKNNSLNRGDKKDSANKRRRRKHRKRRNPRKKNLHNSEREGNTRNKKDCEAHRKKKEETNYESQNQTTPIDPILNKNGDGQNKDHQPKLENNIGLGNDQSNKNLTGENGTNEVSIKDSITEYPQAELTGRNIDMKN